MQLLTVCVVYEIGQPEILVASASLSVYGADVIALPVKDTHSCEIIFIIVQICRKEIVVIKVKERKAGYGPVRFQGYDLDIAGYVLKYCRNGFVGVNQDYAILIPFAGCWGKQQRN